MSGVIFYIMVAVFFLNLTLNFAPHVFSGKTQIRTSGLLARCGVFALCDFILYLFWTFCLSPLSLGYIQYFLLFPAASLLCRFFEWFFFSVVFKVDRTASDGQAAPTRNAYSGMAVVTLPLLLNLAGTIPEALIFSILFPAGVFLVLMIVKAIQFRSASKKESRAFSIFWVACAIVASLSATKRSSIVRALQTRLIESQYVSI
jgi:hypothetical protein